MLFVIDDFLIVLRILQWDVPWLLVSRDSAVKVDRAFKLHISYPPSHVLEERPV